MDCDSQLLGERFVSLNVHDDELDWVFRYVLVEVSVMVSSSLRLVVTKGVGVTTSDTVIICVMVVLVS